MPQEARRETDRDRVQCDPLRENLHEHVDAASRRVCAPPPSHGYPDDQSACVIAEPSSSGDSRNSSCDRSNAERSDGSTDTTDVPPPDAAGRRVYRPEFGYFRPAEPVTDLRGNLPHWRQDDVTYFVTFRLTDSLPQARLDQWLAERRQWLTAHPIPWDDGGRRQATLVFSDGHRRTIDLKPSAEPQVFTFDARRTSSVRLENAVDGDPPGGAALIEFEAWGRDRIPVAEDLAAPAL